MIKPGDLRDEMRSLEERFLTGKEDPSLAVSDPTQIPADLLGAIPGSHGEPANPAPDELPPLDEPTKEPDENFEVDPEEDLSDLDSESARESLDLILDISSECVEKGKRIMQMMLGGQSKAEVESVIDDGLVDRLNGVIEQFVELSDMMEEVFSPDQDEPEEEPDEEPEEDSDEDLQDEPGEESEPEEASEEFEEED